MYFQTLLILSTDPAPAIANLAKKIVNKITLKVRPILNLVCVQHIFTVVDLFSRLQLTVARGDQVHPPRNRLHLTVQLAQNQNMSKF